jgi:hypothetical protein
MTMADEGGEMLSGAWTFAGTLEKHAPKDFRWHFQHMPDENHGSIPGRTTYDGLEWTFQGWNPMPLLMPIARDEAPAAPAMEALELHYRRLSDRIGWEVLPSADLFWNVGGYLVDEGRAEDGVDVFAALVSWYPRRPSSHVGLASALTAACRWDEARARLNEARALARESGDERDMARVEAGMESLEAALEAGTTCGADPGR